MTTTCAVVAALASIAALGARPAAAETASLWVLRPPDSVVALDLADFHVLQTVAVPAAAFDPPERMTVNARGRMIVTQEDGGVWIWDGTTARSLPAPALPDPSQVERPHRWLLGAGDDLYVAVNAYSTSGPDSALVVKTRFHVDRLDFAGRVLGRVVEHAFAPCACATGVCSETCLEARAWAPAGVVDGALYVTHWVPGQLGSTFGPSFRYAAGAGPWRRTALEVGLVEPLDAVASGTAYVEAEWDPDCCGWSNEGSDQTVLVRGAEKVILFDEWERHHNQDYDVSFYTSAARLSPSATRVALTLRATEPAGTDVRLSSEGHADTARLAAIQRALAELPAVEIQELRAPGKPTLRIPRAELVGWSGPSEILVVEGGRVVAVDVDTRRRRESGVRVRGAADAFVVWR